MSGGVLLLPIVYQLHRVYQEILVQKGTEFLGFNHPLCLYGGIIVTGEISSENFG
jgi:hypothetical protein